MQEFERLIRLWKVIKQGSVECILSQENEMFGVRIDSESLIIDIRDPKAVKMVWPIIMNYIKPKMTTRDHIQEKGSILLGVLVSFKAKKSGITNHLSMIQDLAKILAENKKCVIIKEKGKQLAKIGYGVDSFGMRLLNLSYIEVNDLSALMRLFEEAMIS